MNYHEKIGQTSYAGIYITDISTGMLEGHLTDGYVDRTGIIARHKSDYVRCYSGPSLALQANWDDCARLRYHIKQNLSGW
jgi:hypothetical protein